MVCSRAVWKNKKFSLIEKYVVKSITYLAIPLVKPLFSRIKSVESSEIAHFFWQKFRESNSFAK